MDNKLSLSNSLLFCSGEVIDVGRIISIGRDRMYV